MISPGGAATRVPALARRRNVALLLLAVLFFWPCRAVVARADEVEGEAPLAGEQLAVATGPSNEGEDWAAWEAEFDTPQNAGFSDPLEPFNRKVFAVNVQLDRWFFDPLTRGYARIAPPEVRRMVLRGFDNMRGPSVFVNDLLQREWIDACTTLIRFALNTSFGMVGMFDVAQKVGAPGHYSDFGQTLALYGTPSGPYLILPAIGPTTVRDLFGNVVDVLFQPSSYLLPGVPQILFFEGTIKTASGFTLREANYDALQALSASSVDYYAAMHSAYSQDRLAQIWARRESHRSAPAS